MAKTELTNELELAIHRATSKLGVFSCFEVTIGFGGRERVDYMTVDTKGTWRCYEVKVSLKDFRSKAKTTFCGHYNYYVMTQELFDKVKDEIPKHIGVYVRGSCVKQARRQELVIEEDMLKMSMIRSLSRETDKSIQSGDVIRLAKMKRRAERLERELSQSNRDLRDLEHALFKRFGRGWRDEIENV